MRSVSERPPSSNWISDIWILLAAAPKPVGTRLRIDHAAHMAIKSDHRPLSKYRLTMKLIAALYCGSCGPLRSNGPYGGHHLAETRIMRIGIRLAISALVLASILISVGAVHALWWRTAEANSRELASTINQQIVAAVEKEIAALDTAARSAHSAIRTLFFQNVLETREADKREFVFLSQLQSQPALSWVAFGLPDGTFSAAHKLGDEHLEMMEVSQVDGALTRRIDKYLVVVGDIEFEQRSFEKTGYKVTDQEWYRS